MEIRIYKSIENMTANKYLFCSRIASPDAFSYNDAISVFRSIYGTSIIIQFIVV